MNRALTTALLSTRLFVCQLIRPVAQTLSLFRFGRLLLAVSIPRLVEHPLRSSLTTLGVGLGVAMLVAVLVVNDSLVRGISATVDDLAGTTDLQVSAGGSGFDEALLQTIKATPGVARVVPVLQQTASVLDPRARNEHLIVMGVDMFESQDSAFRKYGSPELEEIRNDPLPFLNSPSSILLSRSFAATHGYKLHDTITLSTGAGVTRFDIWGFLDDAGVGRAFGGAVGVMYYQAMQVAYARGTNIDRVDIAVSDDESGTVANVEARLRAALGDGFIVEPPSATGSRMGQMLAGVRNGLSFASVIALLVSSFLIHNTMLIAVAQRRREIGVLRALGLRRKDVVALLTLEGALLGIAGSVLGVALGISLSRLLLNAATRALSEIYLQIAATDIHVGNDVLLAGLGLGTLTAMLASGLPARRAADNPPADTLRTANVVQLVPRPLGFTRSDALGLTAIVASRLLLLWPAVGGFAALAALFLAAALLIPRLIQLARYLTTIAHRYFSVEARLAHTNLARDLGRTSTTAGALMTSVALAVSFGTFIHSFTTALEDWVSQTMLGDLFVTQGASLSGTSMRNIPMGDALSETLAQIPGVAGVQRSRVASIPFRGLTAKALTTDFDEFLKRSKLLLLEGERDAYADAVRHGAVGVSENLSRRFNVHKDDLLAVSTQNGTREFRVAGVFVDYSSDVGSIFFDRPTFIDTFHDDRVDAYLVHLHHRRDSERVRRAIIQRFGSSHDLFVLTHHEFRAEVSRTFQQVFSLVRVLELVALIVAVLGIVNAQLANVVDRLREIGVLRALGMLRRQVRRMIVVEAALMGALGTLAGILLGMGLGDALLNHINIVQTGWHFAHRLSPTSILEVLSLTILAATVGGLYPAHRAAKLRVTQALESE